MHKQQFGVGEVLVTGDRGMLKAKGKAALDAQRSREISALTRPQVRALLDDGVLRPDLFDEDFGEVAKDGKRVIARRNERIQRHAQARRANKLEQLEARIADRSSFVSQSISMRLAFAFPRQFAMTF